MALITFGKTASKPNFLFGKLPLYFKTEDSYKDGSDEGLLERYLEIFCTEIDDDVSPYIDQLLDITNAEALPNFTGDVDPINLLTHISELFGNPPDIGTDTDYSGGEAEYIVLIRYIRQILQTKGTEQSLIYFLAIYGYQVNLLTSSGISSKIYDEFPTPLKYDNNVQYDAGFTFYSGFDLIITDKPGITHAPAPTQGWLDDYLKPAIQKFIAPMWATLGTLTHV
jgi:hypothetical protein